MQHCAGVFPPNGLAVPAGALDLLRSKSRKADPGPSKRLRSLHRNGAVAVDSWDAPPPRGMRGYPLKLVPGNSHLYLRWEDRRTKLNVEATSEGFVSHPDEEYWRWPQPVTARQAEKYGLFKSFSRQDELACFLSARGQVLMANDEYESALKYHELAEKVSPHSEVYRLVLSHVRPYVRYRREFAARKRAEAQALRGAQEARAAKRELIARYGEHPANSTGRIFPDPAPSVVYPQTTPATNGFTPQIQQNRNRQPQTKTPYATVLKTKS